MQEPTRIGQKPNIIKMKGIINHGFDRYRKFDHTYSS